MVKSLKEQKKYLTFLNFFYVWPLQIAFVLNFRCKLKSIFLLKTTNFYSKYFIHSVRNVDYVYAIIWPFLLYANKLNKLYVNF